MGRQIQLPVNEGPVPREQAFFRTLDSENPGLNFGSLERDAFAELGDWYGARRKDGYGFVYRIGVKEGIIDSEGDPATAMLMFWLPFTREGLSLDRPTLTSLKDTARKVVSSAVIHASRFYDNLIGALMSPQEYMLDDLKKDWPYARFLDH